MTFREVGFKTSMDWPVILLFADTYMDYHSHMSSEQLHAIKQAKKEAEKIEYIRKLRIQPNRYMNLFGTWGPPAFDFFAGMSATYWRKNNRSGLKDIFFGEKKTDVVLDLSINEMYYFMSNWLFSHVGGMLHSDTLKIINMNEIERKTYLHQIKDVRGKEPEGLYRHVLRYAVLYLLDVHDKILSGKLSLASVLSLNGVHLIGALLVSNPIRNRFTEFFRQLLENKETLSREWQAIVALILDNVVDPISQVVRYDLLREDLGVTSLDSFERWITSLETDEFGIFEEYDHFAASLKLS